MTLHPRACLDSRAVVAAELACSRRPRSAPEAAPLQATRVLAGHHDRWWYDLEAEAPVVVAIAHQEHEVPAQIGRASQALEHERASDAHGATGRIRRDRPQEQGRLVIEPNRPVADRPDEPTGLLGHEAELAHAWYVSSITVRDLGVPVGTERRVEEGLDGGPVVGPFVPDQEHGCRAAKQEGGSTAALAELRETKALGSGRRPRSRVSTPSSIPRVACRFLQPEHDPCPYQRTGACQDERLVSADRSVAGLNTVTSGPERPASSRLRRSTH